MAPREPDRNEQQQQQQQMEVGAAVVVVPISIHATDTETETDNASKTLDDETTSLLHRKRPSTTTTAAAVTTHGQPDDGKTATALPAIIRREVYEQSKTFVPALQSMIFSKLPWFITLKILGTMDQHDGVDLAAGALATTICNVTGMSLCVGFSFALSTLAGQAKGEMFARQLHNHNRKKTNTHTNTENNNDKSTSTSTSNNNSNNDTVSCPTGSYDNNNNYYGSNSIHSGTINNSIRSILSNTSGIENDRTTNTINTPIVFLFRGLFVQFCLVLPVGIWWLFGIEETLIQLGQEPAVANKAAQYLTILTPSLWSYSLQWTLTAWVQAIGLADVPATASILGFLLHVPFNYFFVYYLHYGWLGCAYATIAFQTVQLLYITIYLFGTRKGRHRILVETGGQRLGLTSIGTNFRQELYVAVSCFEGYYDYLALALPGIVIISEWWASETAIFLAGQLQPNPQTTLAAMTIYQSINSFCFMIPVGFSVAGCARVSNLLGGGYPKEAELAGKINVVLCALCSGMLGIVLFLLPHTLLPSLFVGRDGDGDGGHNAIIEQTAKTIPLLSIYIFADGIKTGFESIIKGCGRQRVVVPIVIISYWIVGVPLAYYLGLVRTKADDTLCASSSSSSSYYENDNGDSNSDSDGILLCGDLGLVAGMTTGTWCHMLLTALVVIVTTNWNKESIKAKERVQQKSHSTEAK